MRYISASLAAVAAAALLTGATGADSTTASAMPASQLPPPDIAGAIVAEQQAYRIGAFDALDITVFQVDLLTRSVQVDATGHIEFPMIGDVTAAGKTAKELGDDIAAKLDKAYLRSPQVTVVVKDSASQKFTVEGAVKASGVFPVVGHMTLLRAIATAQGVDPDAKLRDVVIFRMVDQKRLAGVVNLGDVRKGKADDPQIFAGDVIVVPMSAGRKAMHDLISITPLLFFAHP